MAGRCGRTHRGIRRGGRTHIGGMHAGITHVGRMHARPHHMHFAHRNHMNRSRRNHNRHHFRGHCTATTTSTNVSASAGVPCRQKGSVILIYIGLFLLVSGIILITTKSIFFGLIPVAISILCIFAGFLICCTTNQSSSNRTIEAVAVPAPPTVVNATTTQYPPGQNFQPQFAPMPAVPTPATIVGVTSAQYQPSQNFQTQFTATPTTPLNHNVFGETQYYPPPMQCPSPNVPNQDLPPSYAEATINSYSQLTK